MRSMANKTRDFDISDVLSVTTGLLVSTRHIDGVNDILGFMSGEELFTHQLPRVGNEAKPVILKQHPQLAEISSEGIGTENWQPWLAEMRAKYGDTFTLSPMNIAEHERIDPLSEAAEYFPPRAHGGTP